jgi:hypothetical protein
MQQAIDHTYLAGMESRFAALLPMLIKQKLKDSGSGHQKL